MSNDEMMLDLLGRIGGSIDSDQARANKTYKEQEEKAKSDLKLNVFRLLRWLINTLSVTLSIIIPIFITFILVVFCYIVYQYVLIQLENPKDFLVFCDKLFAEIQSFFGAFSLGAIAVGILTNKLSDRIK